jgi:hypothetical protein
VASREREIRYSGDLFTAESAHVDGRHATPAIAAASARRAASLAHQTDLKRAHAAPWQRVEEQLSSGTGPALRSFGSGHPQSGRTPGCPYYRSARMRKPRGAQSRRPTCRFGTRTSRSARRRPRREHASAPSISALVASVRFRRRRGRGWPLCAPHNGHPGSRMPGPPRRRSGMRSNRSAPLAVATPPGEGVLAVANKHLQD